MPGSLFPQSCRLSAHNYIKRHRCFPVNFANFLRIPILKIICERLFKSMHSRKPSARLALLFAEACSFVTVFIYYLEQENREDLLI